VYWETGLSASVGVAVGLAGFSGIIAALRAGGGTWSENDRVNLEALLGASGFAILFSLLPFVVFEFLPPRIAWKTLSFIYAGVFVMIPIVRLAQFRRGVLSGRITGRITLATLPMVAVLLVNGWWLGMAWPYLLIVLSQLVRAFVSFALLLRPGNVSVEGTSFDGRH
jgi:hypothetical protein